MCHANSLTAVEGVPVAVLGRNTSKKIPWVVLPKVQSALKYRLDKLWDLGGIYDGDDGQEVFASWLNICLDKNWDGDLKALAEIAEEEELIKQDDSDEDVAYHSSGSADESTWDIRGYMPAYRSNKLPSGYRVEYGYPTRPSQAAGRSSRRVHTEQAASDLQQPSQYWYHPPAHSSKEASRDSLLASGTRIGVSTRAPAIHARFPPGRPCPLQRPTWGESAALNHKIAIPARRAFEHFDPVKRHTLPPRTRHNQNAFARLSRRTDSDLFQQDNSTVSVTELSTDTAQSETTTAPSSVPPTASASEVGGGRAPEAVYKDLAILYAELALIEYCLDATKLGKEMPTYVAPMPADPNTLKSIGDEKRAQSRGLFDELEKSTWNPFNRDFGVEDKEKLEATFATRILSGLVEITDNTCT
ncbi:hypothetical protein PG988_004929 [Apiospora saccharicola]